MEVLIVGAGSMGRWVAGLLDASVTFADVDPEAATTAAAAYDAATVELPVTGQYDVVCIAVPLSAAESAIEATAQAATEAIVDLTGRMTEPVAAMAEHAPALERLSLHPLFSPENAPGRIAVVEAAAGPTTTAILSALDAADNTLVETTPAAHDAAMKTVQARAHAAILAFALAADTVPDGFGTPVYDGLMDLVEEVTGGTPRVYADIQAAFDGAEDVAAAARRIADADPETFERLYRDASR